MAVKLTETVPRAITVIADSLLDVGVNLRRYI